MFDLLSWLHSLSPPAILLVAAMMIMAEAGLIIGVVLPGASLLLTLGVLAELDVVHPVLAAATASVAAVLGTQFAYFRAKHTGFRVPAKFLRVKEKALWLFQRAELPALCLGQWLVGVRTLAPRLAAGSGVPYRRFVAVNAPTAAVWGATIVVLGYLAGAGYQQLSQWIGIGSIIILVVLLALAWGLSRHMRSRRVQSNTNHESYYEETTSDQAFR